MRGFFVRVFEGGAVDALEVRNLVVAKHVTRLLLALKDVCRSRFEPALT
jgi:hypothetical protein